MLSLSRKTLGLGALLIALMLTPGFAIAGDVQCHTAAEIHHIARTLFNTMPRCSGEATPLQRARCLRAAMKAASDIPENPPRDPHCPSAIKAVAAGALQSLSATAAALERQHIKPEAARAQAAAVLAAWTQVLTDAVEPPGGTSDAALAEQNRRFDIASDGALRFNKTIVAIFPDLFADLIDIHCQTADAGQRTFTSCYGLPAPASR